MYQQTFDNANSRQEDNNNNNNNNNDHHHSHHDYFSSHSYDPSFFHFTHSDITADPLMLASYAHSLDSSPFLLDDETFFLHQLQPEQPELSSWDFAAAAASAGLLPPANEYNATTGTDFSLLPQTSQEHQQQQQQRPSPPQQTQQPEQQLPKKQSRLDCLAPAPKQKRRSTASNNTSTSTSANTNSDDKEVDHSRRLTELQARFRVQLTSRQNSNKKGSAAAEKNSYHKPRPLPPAAATISDQLPKAPSTSSSSSSCSAAIPAGEQQQQQQQQPAPESSSSSSSYFPSRTMPIQIQRVHGRPNSLSLLGADKRQRQLDQQLERIDFEDITVAELKEMLRQRGKQATGKKAVLVQRLKTEREHRRLEAIKDPLPSPTTLINRSMAAMQLNSPGGGGSRRFMPYGGAMAGGYQQQQQQQHKYAPVVSSALATPDQEEEVNPFDHLIMQYDMGLSVAEPAAAPNGSHFSFLTGHTNQGYFDGLHQSM